MADNNQLRIIAQNAVQLHVNRKGAEHSWNHIHVLWVHGVFGKSWEAFVRVIGLPDKFFQVTYDRQKDEMRVDTFTRKHVSRYY